MSILVSSFFQLLSSVVKYACVLVLILTLSAIHVCSSIDPKCEFLLLQFFHSKLQELNEHISELKKKKEIFPKVWKPSWKF